MSDARTLIIPTNSTRPDAVLSSLFSEVPAQIPAFVKSDGETLALILADPSNDPSRVYDCRPIPAGTSMILGLGLADAAPTAGTFSLAYNGNSTGLSALPYNVTAAALAAALNGNAARLADGPVTVSQVGDEYLISDVNVGARQAFTADGSQLVPLSGVTVSVFRAGDAQTRAIWILSVRQSLYAQTSTFTPLPPESYTLTTVQAGVADVTNPDNSVTLGKPAVQTLTLDPAPYGGTFTVDGAIIPYNASATTFANAYGGVTVTRFSATSWQFTQATNGPKVSTVSLANLLVPTGMLVTLNCSTQEFLFAFANSADPNSITVKLSLQVVFPGQLPKTFLLADCTVLRSVIDANNLVSASAGLYPQPPIVNQAVAQAARASRYGYANLETEAADAIDEALVGLTPNATTQNLFSTYDTVNGIFRLSPTCWAAGVDLSCVSVWNSANADGTGGNRGCATLVAATSTACYAVSNHHFAQPYQVGVTHVFVGQDGQKYPLTITASAQVGTTDAQLLTFGGPLSTALSLAPVLASGLLGSAVLPTGTPLLSLNQAKQAVVSELLGASGGFVSLRAPTVANRAPWGVPVVGGDSDSPTFALLQGRAILVTSYTTTAAGPNYADLAAPINALLPPGCTLQVARLNPLPTTASDLTAANNTWTGTNTFQTGVTFGGAWGNPDGTILFQPDGSASFADGAVTIQSDGSTTINEMSVYNLDLVDQGALPASVVNGRLIRTAAHVYVGLGGVWKQLDN